MWIIIVIVLVVIILVAVVKNDNKQIQIDHLQNGGFRKSYPLVTKCLKEEFEMSFFEDLGNRFSYSKSVKDVNNKFGTLFVGLELNSGRETIIFSTYISSDGVKHEGMNVSTIYDSKKYIVSGINISMEKLVNDGVLPKEIILSEFSILFNNEKATENESKNSQIDFLNKATRIHVENPGNLSKQIPKEIERKITHLVITGLINQRDLDVLNIMGDGSNYITGYNLKNLDMSDAILESDFIEEIKFFGSKKLEYVKLPNNLKIIQNSGFGSCNNLKWVHLGYNIEIIEKSVFQNCTSLESISFGDKLLSIGESAFYNCTSLKVILLPNNLKKISKDVFSNCTSLETIKLPISVTEIGENAFYNCSALNVIFLPKGLKKIGTGAFSFCESLETIEIPDNVLEIGKDAFRGCNLIKTLKLPNSLTKIDDFAFKDCENIDTITLGSNLEYIGQDLFEGCVNLTDIYVDENNLFFCSINGVLFDKNITKIIKYPTGKKQSSFKIPETVKIIEYGAFQNNTYIESIDIPAGTTSIGTRAFAFCHSITKIVIPVDVIEINEYAFCECTNLESITFLSKEISIRYSAFYECDNVLSIFIQNENPPKISEGSMGNLPHTDKTRLFVPKGSKELYQTTDYWKWYNTIIEFPLQ